MTGEELTALVDQLRWDRRRHPYRGRREYSQIARELADACEGLIGSGRSALAVTVLRRAVDRMTSALQYLDDSSGIVGEDLQGLATRCRSAPRGARNRRRCKTFSPGRRSDWVEAGRSPTQETLGRVASGADNAGTGWYCQTARVRLVR